MKEILDQYSFPDDLNELTLEELNLLADEIRAFLLQTISETGGHLASNLGVIELTLALYSTLDLYDDKVIWDVGHQAYTHKILTGRKDRMHTLRQHKGLSGFPKRDESHFDVFGTGHTSTSLSAAMGFAQARNLLGENHNITAVIGDGALTGGMAFEALNHIGDQNMDLNIIINDNEMSIAPNVGAFSQYLNRLRSNPHLTRLKDEIDSLLKSLPAIGEKASRNVGRLKEAVKHLFLGGLIFEELGFTYLGPIDGHDIKSMKQTFTSAFKVKGPKVFHVLTVKGKGYNPAEKEPRNYHGTPPFLLENGQPSKSRKKVSYSQAFGRGIVNIAEEDKRVLAITAAMPQGTGLRSFSEKFPERFYDVGIAEQHAVTFAAGLAARRLRPVVAVYSTFLQRAYDQIIHDVCLQNLPVTFAIDRAGLVGADGPTHHGLFDLSYLLSIPNMVVMAPSSGKELLNMLYSAVNYNGPAALRYPRGEIPELNLFSEEEEIEFSELESGQANLIKEGKDLYFLGLGSMVQNALKASRMLAKEGISAGVIDCRYAKPLDRSLILNLAQKELPLITVEENISHGGFGSKVFELLKKENVYQKVKIKSLALPDKFIEHGSREKLFNKYGLSPEKIKEQVLEFLEVAKEER